MFEVWVSTDDEGDMLFHTFEDEETAYAVSSALEDKLRFLYSWVEEV